MESILRDMRARALSAGEEAGAGQADFGEAELEAGGQAAKEVARDHPAERIEQIHGRERHGRLFLPCHVGCGNRHLLRNLPALPTGASGRTSTRHMRLPPRGNHDSRPFQRNQVDQS